MICIVAQCGGATTTLVRITDTDWSVFGFQASGGKKTRCKSGSEPRGLQAPSSEVVALALDARAGVMPGAFILMNPIPGPFTGLLALVGFNSRLANEPLPSRVTKLNATTS